MRRRKCGVSSGSTLFASHPAILETPLGSKLYFFKFYIKYGEELRYLNIKGKYGKVRDTQIKWWIISKSVTIIIFVEFIDQLIDYPIIRASLSKYCSCRPRWLSWMRIRLETRRSRVRPPPRSATFFHGDWSWNIFYGHSLPSADSRRAVVSFWRKNVHNTG